MDKIIVHDLEVWYYVGVSDSERQQPQRLLLTLELEHDFRAAMESDDLQDTIDYGNLCERLLNFGEDRAWKLIEKLASDIADFILNEYGAQAVSVEVKKMVITAADYVSVRLRKTKEAS